jgi:hypothetical protein
MPDDHSKLAPLLPIPNRTVKRLRADDSADPCVKVGHRQALTTASPLAAQRSDGVSLLSQRCLAPASAALRRPLAQGVRRKTSDPLVKRQETVS